MSTDIESKRLMAVDPGSKHIGVALSDPSGTITRPFCTIQHTSREEDAKKIVQVALQNNVIKIKSPKRQKLTCIICNQQLSITDNDHKCSYRI